MKTELPSNKLKDPDAKEGIAQNMTKQRTAKSRKNQLLTAKYDRIKQHFFPLHKLHYIPKILVLWINFKRLEHCASSLRAWAGL